MSFRKPAFRVEINGTDYTSRFQPLVTSIDVTDRDGLASDTATIKLADADGCIALPEEGDKLTIHLGHDDIGVGQVFSGFIDEVNSSGSKGGGRELSIGAKGLDTRSKAKEQRQRHKDDAKFGDVAKEWGKDAGLEVVMPDSLASIEDDYWSMNGESYIAWAERKARDLGATFKVQDGKAIFVETNGGKTAGGKDLPTIAATWGDNLLRWDISPVVSRPRHKKTRARYYDQKEAKWKEVDVDVDTPSNSDTVHTHRFAEKDEKSARRKAEALKQRSERNSGQGTIVILGTPDAKPEANCILVGARPGIDGEYRISGVQHRLSKQGGYTVTLDIKQPQGEAGKDSRRKKASKPKPGRIKEAGAIPPAPIG